MSKNKKILHMIGNAHIDPVWLWRFQDGLSEIKATFQSAIDRIKEYDDFVFTCGCAMYYEWVEENCPALFEEIKDAVKNGRWVIVGGMWIQPDCNIPSSESFARQMLYAQNYFKEKFGIQACTGYNVDSFGHSGGLPCLLREGGIENYVYMRPFEEPEMKYPFEDLLYRWKCGKNEVLAYRIWGGYAQNIQSEEMLVHMEQKADECAYPIMIYYGVGNHGGGPTIKNINHIMEYRENSKHDFLFSDPNRYFDMIRREHTENLPCYTGELQNHASGCYSANSKIKLLNRVAENRLNEAEKMEVLSATFTDHRYHTEDNRRAWKSVLFNQFHDIICGCATKAALEDAYAFEGSAIAHGIKLTNEAVQRISWNIDTHREGAVRCKDIKGALWESNDMGTPIVVFNPLSYPITIPVSVHLHTCSAVTDESNNPIPHQMVRADYTNRALDTRFTSFMAEVPAYGWRTYWVYREKSFDRQKESEMQIGRYCMSNDKISVQFDPVTGEVSSMRTPDGELLGDLGCRTIVIDDSLNDTWAHGRFVFEDEKGMFGNPHFKIVDKGEIQVSLRITQTYQSSTLERTYTLYRGNDTLFVDVRLLLNEKSVMVKMTFDTGISGGEFIREVPGALMSSCMDEYRYEESGRELPMLRYMALRSQKQKPGLAVINNAKYSASCRDGELRMVVARSCYYGDHYGQRDGLEKAQDMGEQEFKYAIRVCGKNLVPVTRVADYLNTEFPVITETYHKGNLPQRSSNVYVDTENVTITCIKPLEDGKGIMLRLTEVAGQDTICHVDFRGTIFEARLQAFEICSFRIVDGNVMRSSFLED